MILKNINHVGSETSLKDLNRSIEGTGEGLWSAYEAKEEVRKLKINFMGSRDLEAGLTPPVMISIQLSQLEESSGCRVSEASLKDPLQHRRSR